MVPKTDLKGYIKNNKIWTSQSLNLIKEDFNLASF